MDTVIADEWNAQEENHGMSVSFSSSCPFCDEYNEDDAWMAGENIDPRGSYEVTCHHCGKKYHVQVG